MAKLRSTPRAVADHENDDLTFSPKLRAPNIQRSLSNPALECAVMIGG
jgi:hypothetical protein